MAKKKPSRDQKRKRKKQPRLARQPVNPNRRLIQRLCQHGFEQKIARNPPGPKADEADTGSP